MANQPPNQPQDRPQGSSQQQSQPQGRQQGRPQQQPAQQQPLQQPPQQPPNQPPRGGRRPAGGGGNNPFTNAGKVALAIAIVGIAIGLIPLLFGFVGDVQALYGTEDAIDQHENRFQDVPAEQRDQAQERESAQQQQSLVRFLVGGASADFASSYWPGFIQMLALLASGIVGAIVAVRVSGQTSDVLLTASVGALIGAFLFVFLATFLATLGWETVPQTGTQEQPTEVSIQYGALLINSAVIGVLGAIAGGGSAFFTDQIGE